MTYYLFLGLTLFAFVSSITPGPNNLMLMASGVNYGFRRTIPHMLGIGLGFGVMIAAIGFGLGALFEALPTLQLALKIFAVGYLAYLAWRIATAPPMQAVNDSAQPTNGRPFSFMQAALFQWVNPKAWAMGLTAISVYVPLDNPVLGVLFVVVVFVAINVPCVSSWAFAGQQMRRFLQNPRFQRGFNLLCASLLIASLYPMVA